MASKPTCDDLFLQVGKLQKEIKKNRQAIADLKREQLFSEKVLDSLPGIF